MSTSPEVLSRDLLSSPSSTSYAAEPSLPGPLDPAGSSAAQLSRRRELGLASRQIIGPEHSSLDQASDGDDQDILEADSQVLSRGVGEGSLKGEIPEGSVELNVQRGILTVEGSSDHFSNEKSAVSRDHQTFPVRVEELGGKGHYRLKSDDPELKEIIRKRLQRAAGVGGERKRPRFSELVFTRQFTAFDRQNSESSPFRGFYTLFWLGTFLLVVKIGARNWNIYGNVFGGNEILTLILQRDLLVLGLTDGILCASTAFCLLLQRLILSGYLSWDRQGWIIQHVSYHLILALRLHQHNQLLFVTAWL